jgi:RNase P subunit RPR2
MEAYCLKCRTKREMKDERQITMKNGKPATQGTCPECGTKMFKIGSGGSAPAAQGGSKSGGTRAKSGSSGSSGRASGTRGRSGGGSS